MLEDQDIPGLERIVLLRDTDRGTLSEPTRTDEVPVFGWDEFLAGAEGVVEGDGALVGQRTEMGEAMAAWRAVEPDDLSDIIFTSGTTGRPKGAMTTHGQTLRTFAVWAGVVGLTRDDRYLIVNPFFHTFGYKAGIIACLLTGATIVPEPVFDVDRVLEKVAAEKHHHAPGTADPLPVDPRPSAAGRPRPLLSPAGGDRGGRRPRRAHPPDALGARPSPPSSPPTG